MKKSIHYVHVKKWKCKKNIISYDGVFKLKKKEEEFEVN